MPRKTASEKYEEKSAAEIASARLKIGPPWLPIESVPRDGREILGVWADDLGTWNLEICHWSESNESCMTHSGILLDRVVGWMARPPLPGESRQP